jgi:hypothetical protein
MYKVLVYMFVYYRIVLIIKFIKGHYVVSYDGFTSFIIYIFGVKIYKEFCNNLKLQELNHMDNTKINYEE